MHDQKSSITYNKVKNNNKKMVPVATKQHFGSNASNQKSIRPLNDFFKNGNHLRIDNQT